MHFSDKSLRESLAEENCIGEGCLQRILVTAASSHSTGSVQTGIRHRHFSHDFRISGISEMFPKTKLVDWSFPPPPLEPWCRRSGRGWRGSSCVCEQFLCFIREELLPVEIGNRCTGRLGRWAVQRRVWRAAGVARRRGREPRAVQLLHGRTQREGASAMSWRSIDGGTFRTPPLPTRSWSSGRSRPCCSFHLPTRT